MNLQYVPTICPYCGCGCGIYLVLKDGRIVGVEPWKEHPVNEGTNCPKGKSAYKFLYSDDRLKKPLIRENGAFREASWEEALNLVAERLKGIPPEAFGAIASGKTTNEESYLLQKFARVIMGTNNIEYCARFCHSATVAGLLPTLGSGVMQTSQVDIEQADCILIAGVNIKETFPMIARRVLRARRKGATVIVIDPRRAATAISLADIHLQLEAGTDVALINGMMSAILAEGLENKEFIEKRTAGFDELRAALTTSPEQAAEITGVAADKIKEAAVAYAKADRGCILYDEGITQHTTGTDNVTALVDLALLTGHIGKPGTGVNSLRGQINGEGTGDMGCLNVFYPGFKRVSPESAEFFQNAWGAENLPTEPGFTYLDMLQKCKVIYLVGANPVMAGPDSTNIKKALDSLDFFVVQDIFLTETAEHAHVVLPTACWVEREGIHAWVDRRVQKINKVIDPPGEAMPDWWIICRLAEKMGYEDKFNFASPAEIFEEIRGCVPQYKGITYERLEKKAGGIHWPCPSEDHPGTPTMFVQAFPTADSLAHFKAVEYKPPAELPDTEYPDILSTGRSLFHYHTGTMTRRTDTLNSEVPECYVEINPEDALMLGVRSGSRIVLETRRGRIEVIARVTERVPQGTVFVPFHFSESCANVLTNPALDPTCKMPEFKVCAVKEEV
ncbi:MAG: formate dehydrogenase [Dehalococcoidia bacterium SM23_28_2]|nr:MAG: formate dehydrogenase [Dehalococcoidia bacterium SM23_28_2]